MIDCALSRALNLELMRMALLGMRLELGLMVCGCIVNPELCRWISRALCLEVEDGMLRVSRSFLIGFELGGLEWVYGIWGWRKGVDWRKGAGEDLSGG
jgi:hypothetical protein